MGFEWINRNRPKPTSKIRAMGIIFKIPAKNITTPMPETVKIGAKAAFIFFLTKKRKKPAIDSHNISARKTVATTKSLPNNYTTL